MSKEVKVQPHEVESRLRRMIRESSQELTESEIAERVKRTSESSRGRFDPEIFDVMLGEAREELKIYEVLGKDFRRDFIKLSRMIEGLESISEWFKEYNMRDLTECCEVTRVTWLSQMKVGTDSLRMIESGYEVNQDYAYASGVFTPLDIYVVPFVKMGLKPIVSQGRDTRGLLNQMRRVVRDIETHPEWMGVPKDAVLGSFKLISSEVAVIAIKDHSNPFTDGLHSFKNWLFITPTGEAL